MMPIEWNVGSSSWIYGGSSLEFQGDFGQEGAAGLGDAMALTLTTHLELLRLISYPAPFHTSTPSTSFFVGRKKSGGRSTFQYSELRFGIDIQYCPQRFTSLPLPAFRFSLQKWPWNCLSPDPSRRTHPHSLLTPMTPPMSETSIPSPLSSIWERNRLPWTKLIPILTCPFIQIKSTHSASRIGEFSSNLRQRNMLTPAATATSPIHSGVYPNAIFESTQSCTRRTTPNFQLWSTVKTSSL